MTFDDPTALILLLAVPLMQPPVGDIPVAVLLVLSLVQTPAADEGGAVVARWGCTSGA